MMENIKKQWIMGLGITMLMGLANTTMLHGMEPEQKQLGPIKEFEMYINNLPKELRQYILSFSDAIIFLSQQPITLAGHTRSISSVAIGDGIVVTMSEDNTAKIWDIKSGQLLHTLAGPNGHTRGVSSV